MCEAIPTRHKDSLIFYTVFLGRKGPSIRNLFKVVSARQWPLPGQVVRWRQRKLYVIHIQSKLSNMLYLKNIKLQILRHFIVLIVNISRLEKYHHPHQQLKSVCSFDPHHPGWCNIFRAWVKFETEHRGFSDVHKKNLKPELRLNPSPVNIKLF